MLYYNFNNYEGFKERFGVRVCGNGAKSRKNKILLTYVKQPELLRNARMTGDYSELNIVNMTQLWSVLTDKITRARGDFYSVHGRRDAHYFWLCGVALASKHYALDELDGVCEDGDVTKVRYINLENNRVFKMKAGRFFNKCLEDMGLATSFPEPVRLWLCEEFQRQWEVVAASSRISKTGDLELHVDDNFSDIYDSDECDGDFGSCMVDDDQWYFYRDAVKAKAAYLRNKEGSIVARCIVFTEVTDDRTGEVLRLAERQYSTDCDECLKRLLVDALIKGGHIDGYKKVGVGCHDNRAYVGVDGTDWSYRHFSIECNLVDKDILSYQDSFIYYNIDERRAYNYEAEKAIALLDDTARRFRCGYDDYNERYTTESLYEVVYNGRYINTDYDTREEHFIYIRGTYYHEDECHQCPYCGEWYHEDNSVYSELTEKEYCCSSCRDNDELRYKREHLMYSEYDDEYFDEEGMVVKYNEWHCTIGGDNYYEESTISVKSLQRLIDQEEVILCNGIWNEVPCRKEWIWTSDDIWGVWAVRARVYND